MVYAATLSESQMLMLYRLILEEFGPNIQHIAGVDYIVSHTISRFPYIQSDKYDTCTRRYQSHSN